MRRFKTGGTTRPGRSVGARFGTGAIIGAILVSLLAGCAQIPQQGSVKDGPAIDSGSAADYLYYSPSGPEAGQTQSQVLTGFLNAATGPQNDFATARQFLTPNLAANWSPNNEVLIQEGSLKTTDQGGGNFEVKLGVSASVDVDGHFTQLVAGTQRTMEFAMVQYKGEWRISKAPNAVVLIRPVFDVIYQQYSLYFFDHSYNYLVPDLRWFPSRSSAATRLVSALLQGPSPWLAAAVETTMPMGTKLAIDAVTVDKDVAQVDLNSAALAATKARRQYFKAQLLATLKQVSGVNQVQILIDRSPQKIGDYVPASTESRAVAPVVLSDFSLRQMSSPTPSQLRSASGFISQVGATDFALTSDFRTLALRSAKGVWLSRLGQVEDQPVLIDTRKNVLSPKFDRRGSLWSMAADGGGLVLVQPAAGAKHWLSVGWLKDTTVVDFAISAEGSRIVVIVKDKANRSYLEVASIVRNRLGVPVAIAAPTRIRYINGNPSSVDWSGENQLTALVHNFSGFNEVTTFTLGGDSKSLGVTPNGLRVVAGGTTANVYLLDNAGALVQYRGYGWTVVAQNVTAAHLIN